MAQTTKEITVDVAKKNLFQAIVAKQNDSNSRFLRVTVCDEGDKIEIPSNATVSINAERADAASKAFAGTVNKDGTVTVPLTNWMLELDDVVRCSISIIGSDDERLTSTSFLVEVEAAETTSSDISEDENYDILVRLISDMSDVKLACETATTNAIAATTNANTAAEAAREAASAIGGSDKPTKIDSWAVVQQLVRLGIAPKVFNIGDQLVCNHSDYGKLTWDIIGIDHDTPANSEYTHSLTIQLHDSLAGHLFDTAEPTNPDSDRASYGSNNWAESSIRQWLNSNGEAGSWWTAKTEYDVEPPYASSGAGFMAGFDEDFLSTVGEVTKITARNTITDGGGSDTTAEKFFLLSLTEVYGGLVNSISEGEAYPYYADNSSLSAADTTVDDNRVKYRNGVVQFWWLRSPDPSDSYSVRFVKTTGSIGTITANTSRGVAPACCII